MLSSRLFHMLFGCAAAAFLSSCADNPVAGEANTKSPVIRWGSDENGSAPFVYRDPADPGKQVGFEKEIADELGERLGRQVEFVQAGWDSLLPALNRGDFDFAMSGIEITKARAEQVAFTQPYYVSTKQLVVRADDTQIQSLADLTDRPVGTLMESTSEKFLRNTRCEVRTYEDAQHPFDDLENGTLDGVFIDLPIAEFYGRPNPKLRLAGKPVGPGTYAIAVKKTDEALRAELDGAITAMKKDGSLEGILRRWNLWNDQQSTNSQPVTATLP